MTIEERIAFHARADFIVKVGYDQTKRRYVVGFEDRGRPDYGTIAATAFTLEQALSRAEKLVGAR
jgi:hypothetical protein